ncbi:hypothetical protein MNBD_NITROSPINAE02-695 [hydrothermal vent metagenome]|uniref:Uncharacterized protein n=1 Tax=hydrothermal vent metagenome TaxID=652676 RepID=A0A3B1CHF7_9ZZZZ
MRGSSRIKLEIKNPRYSDRELKEHLSELIHYSKYAGIDIDTFRNAISKAALVPGDEGLDVRYGGKLILETNVKTANLINQLAQMYPVFSTWEIKMSKARTAKVKGKTETAKQGKKEKTMAKKKAKKKVVKKKAAKKKVAKKKPAKKKAAKKKVAKKKPAKKKAAKKKVAKKKPAKKKAAKKKVAKKKPAKKKAAKKKARK